MPAPDEQAQAQAAVRDNGTIDFGAQVLTIQGDEVLVRAERAMSLTEMQRMLHIFELVIAYRGRVFALLVAGLPEIGLSAETRRCIAQWSRLHKLGGLALVGGSTVTRAIITLTARAIGLIRKDPQPFLFAKSEEEARVWFDELRTKTG